MPSVTCRTVFKIIENKMGSYLEYFKAETQALHLAYNNLYFWQKWFFPRPLSRALEANHRNNIDVYKAAVNVGSFHRWLFKALTHFPRLSKMFAWPSYLFTQKNEFTYLFDGEWAAANFIALANHQAPMEVANA
jgi:hypothetical protein